MSNDVRDYSGASRSSLESAEFNVFERFEKYQSALVERLTRACGALESAEIPYAVVGGQAVIAWVASKDESAIRSTQDADILVQRGDLPRVITALESAGFYYGHAAGLDFFTDGPDRKVREGIHLVFAGEKVRPDYSIAAPETSYSVTHLRQYRVISLRGLVEMKLTSYRLKDRVHLQDMLSVGLLDQVRPEDFPPELAGRLRHVLENPEE